MRVLSICILIYWIIACNDTGVQAKKETKLKGNYNVGDTIIDFYQIEKAYLPHLPDTTLRFNTRADLRNYFHKKIKEKKAFEDSLFAKTKENDFWTLQLRTSSILFDERMESLYFRTLQNQKKDISTIGLLGFFSPYSNIVSVEDRIRFFDSFPENIKQSENGKKTIRTLIEYRFSNNIKKTNFLTSGINAKLDDGTQIVLADIIDGRKSYYLIVLGASWCGPCRKDEMQLKYWFKHLDSTDVIVAGISVDDNEEKWKNYLREENYPWKNYIIEKGMENPLVKSLSFESIPRNFLLDKEGVIVAENTDIRQVLKAYFKLKASKK